eukprot:7377708-Prymnesium_polylepis.1
MGHMCALGHTHTSARHASDPHIMRNVKERPVANLGAQTYSGKRSPPLTSRMQKDDLHPDSTLYVQGPRQRLRACVQA